MTILTSYLQVKLLDSGNWEGGSDKHFFHFPVETDETNERFRIYWHNSRDTSSHKRMLWCTGIQTSSWRDDEAHGLIFYCTYQ